MPPKDPLHDGGVETGEQVHHHQQYPGHGAHCQEEIPFGRGLPFRQDTVQCGEDGIIEFEGMGDGRCTGLEDFFRQQVDFIALEQLGVNHVQEISDSLDGIGFQPGQPFTDPWIGVLGDFQAMFHRGELGADRFHEDQHLQLLAFRKTLPGGDACTQAACAADRIRDMRQSFDHGIRQIVAIQL